MNLLSPLLVDLLESVDSGAELLVEDICDEFRSRTGGCSCCFPTLTSVLSRFVVNTVSHPKNLQTHSIVHKSGSVKSRPFVGDLKVDRFLRIPYKCGVADRPLYDGGAH